ncbi:kinase-like protein [Rickenella mellea]|uniref:Kinase-like protein n=1 Tax=Rickenella mellea TaxID=50990 RepID=A0A4Y7PZ23_9AGAM|nr:kinase-like protein [Rickenella mellea]
MRTDTDLWQFIESLCLDGGRVKLTPSEPIHGGYAVVRKGEFNGRTVAIKTPKNIDDDAEKFSMRQARELGTWARTSHTNVLPLLGYCRDSTPAMSFVSPWMSNGTAIEFVKKYHNTDIMPLVTGIARGLEYLHSVNIVHGDLRCTNILISDEKEPLICDFGLSRHTIEMSGSTRTHGSLRWRAPEMAWPKEFGLTVDDAHSLPADVWSLGMTILEILTAECPYHELKTDHVVFDAIKSGCLPKKSTLEPPSSQQPRRTSKPQPLDILWPFCLQCWVFCPESRPSIRSSVQTLEKLTCTSTNGIASLELLVEDLGIHFDKFTNRQASSMIAKKVKYLQQVSITMGIVSALLFLATLKWGSRQMAFLYPLLAGSATWLILLVDYSRNRRFSQNLMNIAWEVVKAWAWFIGVEIISRFTGGILKRYLGTSMV